MIATGLAIIGAVLTLSATQAAGNLAFDGLSTLCECSPSGLPFAGQELVEGVGSDPLIVCLSLWPEISIREAS